MKVYITRLYLVIIIFLFNGNAFAQNSGLAQKAYAMDSTMRANPDRVVGNLNIDSSAALPLGLSESVGGFDYIIAIDSAYFLPDGAYFSAYMALKFPGAKQKIAFAAKDIKFNPQGVLGGEQARLMLTSDMYIDLGPNITMQLPADGSNFVRWGCNGYESCNLKGNFIFSKKILEPASSADTSVQASFELNFTDVNNLMTTIEMDPFTMSGMDDYVFEVSQAVVDLSDDVNPEGVIMPACYNEMYPGDISLWRGFYLELIQVDLPNALNKGDGPTQIYAQNLFIDNSGLTGVFGGENLITLDEGNTEKKWGFSVELLEIGLTTNKLTSGKMNGDIKIPPLDDNALEYSAAITLGESSRETEYEFGISPEDNLSFSAASAEIELYNSSYIKVRKSGAGKFVPKLIANGKISINNKTAKFPGLSFQQITLLHDAPHISGGVFALTGSESSKGSDFPLSISEVAFGLYNSKPTFEANVALNLGEESDANNFSVETGIRVMAQIQDDNGKNKWLYDKTRITDILIDINTTPFELMGLISHKQDDPIYGQGFYGAASFRIKKVMDNAATFSCAFGKMPTYKYWMVEAMIPTNISIGATNSINAIFGGLSYHMEDTRTSDQLIASISGSSIATSDTATNPRMSMVYVPNKDVGIGFRAGAAVNNIKQDVFNGDVVFGIEFNSSGGLKEITLVGQAYQLCTREQRDNPEIDKVIGTVAVLYDNEEKIFDANLDVSASFYNAITANIYAKFYFSPGLWYVWLGRPSAPCYVNILNLAGADAYFMFGQNLEPMPAPPPQVSSVLGGLSSQRSTGDIAAGNGVSMGVNLYAGFEGSKYFNDEKWRLYGAGSAGMGFDMTLYKYANTTHCSGSPGEPFGANYWFLNGQLYAYLGLDVGVERMSNNKKWNIFSGSAAALLQGKLPNPSYVYGGMNVSISILSILELSQTFDFEFGKNCEVVN
ncbi:MAG: hypothetical protein MK078_17145 [Crocinitomicaceae bacterium]|nr:hypothetical protein [Crocinitomicaceae bacterium]